MINPPIIDENPIEAHNLFRAAAFREYISTKEEARFCSPDGQVYPINVNVSDVELMYDSFADIAANIAYHQKNIDFPKNRLYTLTVS